MKILAKIVHGSRMYGLDNAKSDWDYKQIHLPTHEECYLLKAPRNCHKKSVIDGVKHEEESFALQEFLGLACRGEDVAITSLHVDDKHVLINSPEFTFLRHNRACFYTKGMVGSAGYCRSMASKYALRADRMETVEKVIIVLESMIETGIAKLGQAWDLFTEIPHTRKFENQTDRGLDKRTYEVVGKCLPATVAPVYALEIMTKVRDSYGARVKSAKEMGGDDLKAISHSFRVGYQLKHIFQDGDFYFPLPESEFIRSVKEGRFNYVNDGLDQKLNDLITEVEELSAKSHYPDSVDTKWCDQIVLATYTSQL